MLPDDDIASHSDDFHEASRTRFLAALEETLRCSSTDDDGVAIMPAFAALPDELLPLILAQLRYRQADLAKCCLVNHRWAAACKPLIWEWVRSRDSERIAQAFRAASASPEICEHMKELEVRVFPLSDPAETERCLRDVLLTLQHTKHLTSLAWTRKGTLHDEILDAICQLPQLQRLELNAAAGDDWRPQQLLKLPKSLRSLTLLLPDRDVLAYSLPQWLARPGSDDTHSLRTLSIICRNSTVLNSTTLKDISIGLSRLTSLTLHGCPKLRDADILHAIKACGPLEHLSLEAMTVSSTFWSEATPLLPHLKRLRTSHPGRRAIRLDQYYGGLTLLVQSCPHFESFTHYLTGDAERGLHPSVDASFISALVQSAGRRLLRFEVSGLCVSFESAQELFLGARNLEQLVIPIYTINLLDLQFYLFHLTKLHSLHIVAQGTITMKVSLQSMLEIVKHSSSSLRHIAVQNRLRSVHRELVKPGELYDEATASDVTEPYFVRRGVKTSLKLYDEPLGVWPEALLVVRT